MAKTNVHIAMVLGRGGARICPTRGLGSPTRGLNYRIEGIFLCNITQFSVEKFPDRHEIFPRWGGGTFPDEGAIAPPPPLGATAGFGSNTARGPYRLNIKPVANLFKAIRRNEREKFSYDLFDHDSHS